MAKKALLDVLENTIGRYVLNLDAESLNVAVWSGKIELNHLELDIYAVNAELDRKAAEAPNLALPFRVKSGQFHSLQVDVPWAHLMSRPVIMRAKGLKVIVEPHDSSQDSFDLNSAENEVMRAEKIRQTREKNLLAVEEYRNQTNNLKKLAEQDLDDTSNSSNLTPSSSFGARLVRRIVENIQVEIYDFQVSLDSSEGSAGVVLDTLELVTTDANGERTFVDRTQGKGVENGFLHKWLQIRGFGIYVDEKQGFRKTRLSSIQECGAKIEALEHSYLLAPLSFKSKLRQADSTICFDYPKYLLESQINSLNISLSKTQLDQVRKISAQIFPPGGATQPLFPQYRPLARISKENVSEWWRYAYRCVGRLTGRAAWREFIVAFKKRRKYIPLYKRKAHVATCSWLSPLNDEEETELTALEFDKSISLEGIMTWRNIADAQVEKEREKHEAGKKKVSAKGGIFKSLFGTSEQTSDGSEDNPPVSLTLEEKKELENLSLEQMKEDELSKDSRLCDVKFVLGSLDIHLLSYGDKPLAALEMGTVSTSFDAKQDGSFKFDFKLTSLNILDQVTQNTLFPNILKNRDVAEGDGINDAFLVHASKSKTGDQVLEIRLNTFEAVASPTLVVELKRFVAVSASAKATTKNPVLAQSMSGSVDLFYDADEGAINTPKTIHIGDCESNDQTVPTGGTSDISNALVDAWKLKAEKRTSWILDLDIRAPTLVVPENCVDQSANVLALDLGDLRLQYGKPNESAKVEKWFKENPADSEDFDLSRENASLSINNLTFVVGKVIYWRRLLRKDGNDVDLEEKQIYEPISFKLDIGIETNVKTAVPRICVFGMIPLIALNLSPSQVSRMMNVARAWMRIKKDLTPEQIQKDEEVADHNDHRSTASSKRYDSIMEQAKRGSSYLASLSELSSRPTPLFLLDIRLHRFSVKLNFETKGAIEAHLVSAGVSFTTLSDGSSESSVVMGWFWILDELQNDFARRQRLLAHSSLPKSPDYFAQSEKYAILEELFQIGAFQEDFKGSTELAHVTLKQSGAGGFGYLKPSLKSLDPKARFIVDMMIDAKFSSLNVNWNPKAIKTILNAIDSLKAVLVPDSEVGSVILSSPEQLQRRPSIPDFTSKHDIENFVEFTSVVVLKASMDGFLINLNSAKDDLPLFVLSVSGSQVSLESAPSNMKVSLVLGDLRVQTPELGKTCPSYRTILGLTPGKSDSLLSVYYYDGPSAMACTSAKDGDLREFKSYAKVILSPMRMVHIHSQVLALAEYTTEGILGAMAQKAASSAAAKAAEVALASADKKFFSIEATGFEVIIPQAAYKKENFSIGTGKLSVDYVAFGAPGGGSSTVRLADVLMSDSFESEMQDKPFGMNIDVSLPPDGVGTLEDQALKVGISVSDAMFVLTKPQYKQLLSTLRENIGEVDLFVRDERDDSSEEEKMIGLKIEKSNEAPPGSDMTHSGVAPVVTQRRLYLDTNITALSLLICGDDEDNPLIRVAAVEAGVKLKQIVDETRMIATVTLKDLVCTDQRLKAIGRSNQSLVYQSESKDQSQPQDVFFVQYNSCQDTTSVEFRIGSPRLVFIPDAVADLLAFTKVENSGNPVVSRPAKSAPTSKAPTEQGMEVQTSITHDEIETSYIPTESLALSKMSISLATDRCSLLLVDLGQSSLVPSLRNSSFGGVGAVSETIVLEGIFEAKVSSVTDIQSGDNVTLDAQLHGVAMEAYTAYSRDLKAALQIWDPSQLSLYYSSKKTGENSNAVDMRVAALTSMDISLSMRNVALVNAILSSISESFENPGNEDTTESKFVLSSEETARVEELAHVLEARSGHDSFSEHGSEIADMDSLSLKTSVTTNESRGSVDTSSFSIKLTMPDSKITVINDLQGLDEALLRVKFRNTMAGAQVRKGECIGNSVVYTGFDLNAHATIDADYFDGPTNRWKPLLVKPWELTSKGARGPSKRYQSLRPSTVFDIESFPCCLSFSEQFLANLSSAKQMWTIYSTATQSALESSHSKALDSNRLRRSIAASAARSFISDLPYAVENHTGVVVEFIVQGATEQRHSCESGSLEYFQFFPPQGTGSGGKRLYGQDVAFRKSIVLLIEQSEFEFDSIDSHIGLTSRVVNAGGTILLANVVKEGKTTVVHLSSGVDIYNSTSLPVSIAVIERDQKLPIGRCDPTSQIQGGVVKRSLTVKDGRASRPSRRFGVPSFYLQGIREKWRRGEGASLHLNITPELGETNASTLHGEVEICLDRSMFDKVTDTFVANFDVTCRAHGAWEREGWFKDPLVFQISARGELLDNDYFDLSLTIEPRITIENKLPLTLSLKTPMPHVYSATNTNVLDGESVHELKPGQYLEVYTPGPSIAITFKCTDAPMAGLMTDWMEGWVDLPLMQAFRLPESLQCNFPFLNRASDNRTSLGSGIWGSDFFISQGISSLEEVHGGKNSNEVAKNSSVYDDGVEVSATFSSNDDWRKFYISVLNHAIDHTGDLLFEQVLQSKQRNERKSLLPGRDSLRRSSISHATDSRPFGAFGTNQRKGRTTLLPGFSKPIRLLQLTMEGDEGVKRSAPFCVENISICNGGVNSTPITWEDGKPSGYFAYRNLLDLNFSEIHVVPEYIIFNGSKSTVRVKQPGLTEMVVAAGTIAPLRTHHQETATVAIEFIDSNASTPPMRVDGLGLRVAVVKSQDGLPVGSVALQTVVGAEDSRLVVKLGDFNSGVLDCQKKGNFFGDLENDFLRFRIQWSELRVSLDEARHIEGKRQAFMENALDKFAEAASDVQKSSSPFGKKRKETWMEARSRVLSESRDEKSPAYDPVCTFILHRFTVDWQRVFKDEAESSQKTTGDVLRSPERSQMSVIIHNVQVRDETPGSPYPIVFDSSSSTASFFDLCLRVKGPLDSDLVKVDLFDLNLAHGSGQSEPIVINTSEVFVWKMIDLFNQIVVSAGEFSGVELAMKWDEEHGGFVVDYHEKQILDNDKGKYTPPNSEKLINLSRARVSPFTLLVSFKRNPQSSRYQMLRGAKGSNLMNYFTKHLKFKIERAELKFARYEARDLKGPPDRLVEELATVYISRAKLKVVTILTASSFQDWKTLAARDGGDDEYLEGDILRVTGNIAGNSVNYVLKKAGRGIGDGLSSVTHVLGEGFESATGVIGARKVGKGVNKIVSGVGEGVGNTISGVGSGAGHVIKGAGQGVGQMLGGVTGGAMIMGKGIGKGLVTGDGRAIVQGLSQGATSAASGVFDAASMFTREQREGREDD